VLPHKKNHSLTTYTIALTAREPSLWTLVSLGATDLITSGDWTVPREGSRKNVMLVPIVPADLEASYSKARFPRYFFCCVLDSSLLGTSLGLKNAHGRLGEMGG
jgi:hypothetical protein